VTPTQPPTAPTNFTATGGAGQVSLSWTAPTGGGGVSSYLVYRENPGSTTFVDVGTTSGTTTTYTDTGLAASSTYSYEVEATNAAGNSPFSNPATATTQAPTQPPTAPTNFTATGGAGQVSLSWTAPTGGGGGVTSYLVDRKNPGSTSYVQVGTTSGTTTTYTDPGLAASSTYSYEVQATNAGGNSPFSNPATATTAATIPGLVAAYSFSEGTGTSVADASGNGNNGTISNATWSTAGKYGDALVFNGTNALVTIPDAASLHLTTGMTLEAWVDPSTVTSAWRDVIYKGNDDYFLEATSTKSKYPAAGATVGTSDVATYGTTALTASTWTFLTETYNGSALDLYVNGTLVSSLAETGNIATSTNPLQIGGDSIYGQYFAGTIDQVRIYNGALTAAQITSDMNAAITTQPTAPTNLTASAVSQGQINLSWTASTDTVPVTYEVYRENPGSTSYAQVGTTTGTTYSDTGLTASSTYSYEVRADDAENTLSAFSNVASTTTSAGNPGLVAAYPFDEGTGTTVYDASGNGNNGTISNATWSTAGKYGDALVFNGTNALVTIPDAASLHLTTGMTLEAWVDPSTVTSAWRDVIYKGNDDYFLEATSTKSKYPAAGATVGTSDVATYGTKALTASTWTFLTETYNGSALDLYVNGTLISSLTETGNIATSTDPLQIGGDSIYGQYFKGMIDEVRVYDVALTVAQITSDMNTPITSPQPPTAPTNLTATAVSASPINLSGTASTANGGVVATAATTATAENNELVQTAVAPSSDASSQLVNGAGTIQPGSLAIPGHGSASATAKLQGKSLSAQWAPAVVGRLNPAAQSALVKPINRRFMTLGGSDVS
jgi:fibronectin type 3 domain-containing protein